MQVDCLQWLFSSWVADLEKLITSAVPYNIHKPLQKWPGVRAWEQREMRNKQNIGFISVLGLNLEASGTNTTVCADRGSTK